MKNGAARLTPVNFRLYQTLPEIPMTQDELKRLVGEAAADYVNQHVPEGSVIGVGTGSTANCFIDALAAHKGRYRGAVSSSEASTERLRKHGIEVFDLNQIDSLPVYVDGADEINALGHMIKGGGGALTREKIVASVAKEFVCVVDASKEVAVLGVFPLPVEVIPMAQASVARALTALGGKPQATWLYTLPGMTGSGWQHPAMEVRISELPVFKAIGLEQRPALILGADAMRGSQVDISAGAARICLRQPVAT